MNDKQYYSDVAEPEELPQGSVQPVVYDLGFIRLRSTAWTPQFSSPIYIGEVILDLGL